MITIGSGAPDASPLGIAGTKSFDARRSVYNKKASNMMQLRALLGHGNVSDRLFTLGFVGDSTTVGATASFGADVASVVRNAMVAMGYNSMGTGWSWCAESLLPDTRWTRTGTWTNFNNGTLVSHTVGSTLTWVADKPGTVVEILYYNGGTGSFSYTIDGGTATAVAPTGSSLYSKITISGLANTTHTLVITNNGNFYNTSIVAACCRQAAGIHVTNIAWSGSTALQWADRTLGTTWGNVLAAIAPDHAHMRVGLNDWSAQDSIAAFTTALGSIITDQRGRGGSISLAVPNPASPYGSATAATPFMPYRQAIYGAADQYDLPLIDHYDRFVSQATMAAQGLYSSDPHPNSAGYRSMGLAEFDFLVA